MAPWIQAEVAALGGLGCCIWAARLMRAAGLAGGRRRKRRAAPHPDCARFEEVGSLRSAISTTGSYRGSVQAAFFAPVREASPTRAPRAAAFTLLSRRLHAAAFT